MITFPQIFSKKVQNDNFLRTATGSSVGFLAISLIMIVRFLGEFSNERLSFGNGFIGTTDDFFNVWLIALAITVLNHLFVLYWYYRARFLAYIIAFTTTAFTGLILIAIGGIISANQ
jgi:hypothetical protein